MKQTQTQSRTKPLIHLAGEPTNSNCKTDRYLLLSMDVKADFQQVSIPIDSSPTKRKKPLDTILRVPQIQKDTQDLPGGNKMEKFSALELAEEFRLNLGAEYPTFMKTMVRSNVTTGYWLHLPMQFCKLYMPRHNVTVTLEDEKGNEYKVNYLTDKTGISGGWKVFTGAHNLIEGDILIFQLVKPSRFKVYIVKGNGSSQAHATPAIANIKDSTKQIVSEEKRAKRIKIRRKAGFLEIVPCDAFPNKFEKNDPLIGEGKLEQEANKSRQEKNGDANNLEIVPLNAPPRRIQKNELMIVDGDIEHPTDHSGEEKDISMASLEGAEVSGPVINFDEVKTFEDFTILVNGTSIDSELSEYHRRRYFDLCCTQKSYLHDHLLKNINCQLAAQMITESVKIADAIKDCELSTFKNDHAAWDKTLEGFEMLGMKVGFIRSWLNRLLNLCLESERFRGAKHEQVYAEEEMKTIEQRLLKLRKRRDRLDAEVELLKGKAEKHEHLFMEEVNAPW